jgi:6-pyruvoyltetrahydropterin/6-carboxytetrahydropterin synthase
MMALFIGVYKRKSMKVAKRFRWEGAHRLPWHTDGCQNIHGHSYVMWVELQGEVDEQGMLIDFKEIKKILDPLIASWDHATLIAASDTDLIKAIDFLGTKHYILPYDTTSENLCLYVLEYLGKHAVSVFFEHRVSTILIKVQETDTCYAEHCVNIDQLQALNKRIAVAQPY